jgi:hypothetical protein
MLRYFPPERRRRFAPLLLAVGLLTVGKLTYDEAPRDREVHFLLPGRDVEHLRVTYTQDDEPYGGIERRFPNGAPRELVHTLSLSPGRYDLDIELTRAGAITRLSRSLDAPQDGTLRVRLEGER